MIFDRCSIDSVWILPVACCIIQCFHTGTFRVMPLLFVASMERYNVNRKDASFPYVLRVATEHFVGPFVGFLGCRFHIFYVTLAGCILASLSIAACFFAESIHVVTVFWGILFGIGSGMARHLQPDFLSNYFTSNLARANGIAFLGASIGALIVPPIFEALLLSYGLSGAFFIMSAVNLNAIPAAMILLRKFPTVKRGPPIKKPEEEEVLFVSGHVESTFNFPITSKNLGNAKDLCDYTDNEDDLISNSKGQYTRSPLSGCGRTETLENEKKSTMADERKGNVQNNCLKAGINNIDTPPKNTAFRMHEKGFRSEVSDTDENGISRCIMNPTDDRIQESRTFLSSPVKKSKNKSKWKIFNVFFDPLFQLIALTQSLFFFVLILFIVIVSDFSRDIGIDVNKSVYIVSTLALGDIFARVGLGWVIDKSYMTVTNFSAMCFFGNAIGLSAMTLTKDFIAIVFISFFTGLMIGGQIIVQPGIVTEYFEGQKRTMAIASRTVYIAPLSLTISVLIGFFREYLSSYVWLIYFCSFVTISCGLISLLLPCVSRCRCRIKLAAW